VSVGVAVAAAAVVAAVGVVDIVAAEFGVVVDEVAVDVAFADVVEVSVVARENIAGRKEGEDNWEQNFGRWSLHSVLLVYATKDEHSVSVEVVRVVEEIAVVPLRVACMLASVVMRETRWPHAFDTRDVENSTNSCVATVAHSQKSPEMGEGEFQGHARCDSGRQNTPDTTTEHYAPYSAQMSAQSSLDFVVGMESARIPLEEEAASQHGDSDVASESSV
jgi:hypothetical protein